MRNNGIKYLYCLVILFIVGYSLVVDNDIKDSKELNKGDVIQNIELDIDFEEIVEGVELEVQTVKNVNDNLIQLYVKTYCGDGFVDWPNSEGFYEYCDSASEESDQCSEGAFCTGACQCVE